MRKQGPLYDIDRIHIIYCYDMSVLAILLDSESTTATAATATAATATAATATVASATAAAGAPLSLVDLVAVLVEASASDQVA